MGWAVHVAGIDQIINELKNLGSQKEGGYLVDT